MTQETAFYLLAIIAVLAAVTAVRLRNLIHGVFALVIFFAALAGLFLLLMAQFIAAVQVLVYIGAVGILLLFAIMLTERVTGDDGRRITSRGGFWGATAALGVAVFVLLPGIQQTDLNRLPAELAEANATAADANATMAPPHTVEALGKRLIEPYIITLEVLALLLTAALIGAVAVSQGARRVEDEEEASP
tara:strand:+ start:80 stop:652 length:573 start_codon:yes stop_codon:yes gene_type:complete